MIKIKVTSKQGALKQISISGHALYDDYGKDIVCAAVSSSVITTVNGIMNLDSSLIDFENNQDGLVIQVLKKNKTADILLKNMLSLLEELETQYTENIKIIK